MTRPQVVHMKSRQEAPRNDRVSGARPIKGPVHSAALGPSNSYAMDSAARRIYNHYAPLAYELPWEVLDYVELLSTYNADFSQAVDNVCTLANSGHAVQASGNGVRATRELKSYIEDLAKLIQPSSGGIDGVIDKLLHQACTYGAMAGEWLLDADTLHVVDFADINPKSIRYFWEEDNERWEPYQRVSAAQAQEAEKRGQKVFNGCIKLNEITFHYYSFNNAPNSPYGVPPFIAALEPIGIQREMMANMSQVVKKLGLLGLVDVIVDQLPPLPAS